jgi:thiamine-phosphate pyrophosphorylase
MSQLDLAVYVLTDLVPELGRTHEDVAWAAIQGGASMIQFRDKTMSDTQFAETAARILLMARAAGVPLIVNDRAAIAVAIGADGPMACTSDATTAMRRRSSEAFRRR